MLHRPKFLSTFISRLSPPGRSLQQLRSKACREYHPSDGDDDDDGHEDDEIPKTTENQKGRMHLYKSRGQHLLINPRVLDAIVRKSNIKPTDRVLEIGPGTGNLTLKLLAVAREVIAVEVDKRMVEILNRRVNEHGFKDRLNVICEDALKTEFPQFDLVVANIPYGISSPLVAKLVFGANTFRSATLLLQKEFARRLLANPGDPEFNRLAVNVKLVAEVEFVMGVSKREFLPCPKVDSSVIKIWPKPEVPNVDLDEWWAFTKTCFCKKNKTLGATFKQKKKVIELLKLSTVTDSIKGNSADYHSQYCSGDGDEEDKESMSDKENCYLSSCSEMGMSLFREKLSEVLKSGGFEHKRPSKMSNEEFLQLLSLFNQAGVHFHGRAGPKDTSDVPFPAAYPPL